MTRPAVPVLFTAFLVFSLGLLTGCSRSGAPGATDLARVTVYKSPTCGCCGKWIDHLKENGFAVEVMNMPDVSPMKRRFGVPSDLTSCHTAVVDGYVVEGHVPADVMLRMLTERPDIAGITVAGMPPGSPGMESANPQPFDVVAFDTRGGRYVYASR